MRDAMPVTAARPPLRGARVPTTAPAGRGVPPAVLLAALLAGVVTWQWAAPPAVLVLWAIWRFPKRQQGVPVVSLALTYQWMQASSGLFYFGLIAPAVLTSYSYPTTYPPTDVRPMVLLALASITVMLAGVVLGQRAHPGARVQPDPAHTGRVGDTALWIGYAVLLASVGALQRGAWNLPGLTQLILALNLVRLVALLMLFRRLLAPKARVLPIAALILAELAVGVSGLFADFLKSQLVLILAIIERFDTRRVQHWAGAGAALAIVVFSLTMWTVVKADYRTLLRTDAQFAGSTGDRIAFVFSQAGDAMQRGRSELLPGFENMVNRSWAVYLPAHALQRVPSVTDHENGRLLWAAVRNVLMPRLFFPDKGEIASTSDLVRKYSGVWVAGREVGTSYAFGYAIESYVDFGLPFMFIPIFAFGWAIGYGHQVLMRRIGNAELAAAAVCIMVWRALYLFEESWTMKVGTTVTTVIVLLAACWVVDQTLLRRRAVARWRGRGLDADAGLTAGGRRG